MESSSGSFRRSGAPGNVTDLSTNTDNQLQLSGSQNVSDEAWERMMGSNHTSTASRSSSFGSQQRPSQKPDTSPAGSRENHPSMPESREGRVLIKSLFVSPYLNAPEKGPTPKILFQFSVKIFFCISIYVKIFLFNFIAN